MDNFTTYMTIERLYGWKLNVTGTLFSQVSVQLECWLFSYDDIW